MFQDVKVQLSMSTYIGKREATNFAFHFVVVCSVAIVLGTTGGEFSDVIINCQLVGEITEEVTDGKFWFAWKVSVDYGICAKVENLMLEDV